jgi:hypothetical protein
MLPLVMLFLAACFGVGFLVPSAARAAVTSIPITACGPITHEGYYAVQNNLTTTHGDCIVVAASNVTLDLNSRSITSTSNPKSGAGVHVVRESEGEPEVTGVFIEGRNAQIRGFAAGMENDADGTVAENFNLLNNIDGLLIKRAKGSSFVSVSAGVSSTTGNVNGFHIVGGQNNEIGCGSGAVFNSNYGVWVENSSGNSINSAALGKNGTT